MTITFPTDMPVTAPDAGKTVQPRRYLFGPWIDVMCLGGFTPLLLALMPFESFAKDLTKTAVATLIFYLINTPHFTSTYQLFYRGFRKKLSSNDLPLLLRLRYLFAGVVFPLALAIYIFIAAQQPDKVMIGYVGNLLLFLLGWQNVIWTRSRNGFFEPIISPAGGYSGCFKICNHQHTRYRI
jgi:hypothetical protein